MKVIVAGSRAITDYKKVETAIVSAFNYWMQEDSVNWDKYISPEIVSGGAHGVDWLGEKYAIKHNLPKKIFPAKWDEFGRKAGPLRNIEMGNYADALIAVWDGQSKGTKHMIDYMKKLGKPVYIYNTNE